jgi:hypothetical protein
VSHREPRRGSGQRERWVERCRSDATDRAKGPKTVPLTMQWPRIALSVVQCALMPNTPSSNNKVKRVKCAPKYEALANQRFPTAKVETDLSLGDQWHLQRHGHEAWTIEKACTGPTEE